MLSPNSTSARTTHYDENEIGVGSHHLQLGEEAHAIKLNQEGNTGVYNDGQATGPSEKMVEVSDNQFQDDTSKSSTKYSTSTQPITHTINSLSKQPASPKTLHSSGASHVSTRSSPSSFRSLLFSKPSTTSRSPLPPQQQVIDDIVTIEDGDIEPWDEEGLAAAPPLTAATAQPPLHLGSTLLAHSEPKIANSTLADTLVRPPALFPEVVISAPPRKGHQGSYKEGYLPDVNLPLRFQCIGDDEDAKSKASEVSTDKGDKDKKEERGLEAEDKGREDEIIARLRMLDGAEDYGYDGTMTAELEGMLAGDRPSHFVSYFSRSSTSFPGSTSRDMYGFCNQQQQDCNIVDVGSVSAPSGDLWHRRQMVRATPMAHLKTLCEFPPLKQQTGFVDSQGLPQLQQRRPQTRQRTVSSASITGSFWSSTSLSPPISSSYQQLDGVAAAAENSEGVDGSGEVGRRNPK
ncbi:hypothetical protein HK102_009470, partial [Quaeritorhiza haematococci]